MRGAAWAARRLDGNCSKAEGAWPRRRRRRGLWLVAPLKPVDLADQDEDREGDDDEIENGVDEETVIDRRRAGLLCLGQGGVTLLGQINEEVRGIGLADQQPG